jgi:glutamate transport system permease protein
VNSVLYDEPGPRTRRLTLIVSIVFTILVIGGLYQFVYRPLAAQDQFSMIKWGPLIDPSNIYFDLVWARLQEGMIATLKAAGLAIVSSLVAGTLLAIFRLQLKALSDNRYQGLPSLVASGVRRLTWLLNLITRIIVEVFRGIPLVITIFFAWKLMTGADALWPLVVGLTIYNGIVIAEIVRSGMEGLPKGQREAAASIGLNSLQTTWLVLLPQAIRIMLPAIISQLVVILKDTALGFIIGYQDLLAVSKQVVQALPLEALDQAYANPIQMYIVVGIMFLVVNYALSKLAQYLERRLSRRSSGRLAIKKAGLSSALSPSSGTPGPR